MNEQIINFDNKTELEMKNKTTKKFCILKGECEEILRGSTSPSDGDGGWGEKSGEKNLAPIFVGNYFSNLTGLKADNLTDLENNQSGSQSPSPSRSESNNTKGGCDYNTGRWTDEEHKKFLEAILIYGNEWKKVQKCISTRSSTQARSHAQKFFLRIRKYFKNIEEKNPNGDIFTSCEFDNPSGKFLNILIIY
jgi:SHAQKYF class myb-like DNA-binding protein